MFARPALNQPIEHWNTLINHLTPEKLDSLTHREWEEHRNTLRDHKCVKDWGPSLTHL